MQRLQIISQLVAIRCLHSDYELQPNSTNSTSSRILVVVRAQNKTKTSQAVSLTCIQHDSICLRDDDTRHLEH